LKTLIAVMAFTLLLGPGCATHKIAPKGGASSPENATAPKDEAYGPGGIAAPPSPVYGPEPTLIRPVTLVLGPGQARGFAQAGVLRALVENKIQIGAIYGIGIGSLLGAIYAKDGNINHFEWDLQNFNADAFANKASLLDRFLSLQKMSQSPLGEKLKQEFGSLDISAMKIPLKIAISRPEDAEHTVMDKGPLVQILNEALKDMNTPETNAALEQVLCNEARAQYGSPVVLVETAGTPIDPSSADLVIRPDLSDIAPHDYEKRADAAFRGKTAMNQRMAELKGKSQ
jgi:predicted acylesterase/phospholipase RssA